MLEFSILFETDEFPELHLLQFLYQMYYFLGIFLVLSLRIILRLLFLDRGQLYGWCMNVGPNGYVACLSAVMVCRGKDIASEAVFDG